jgi:serine protease AprX
VGRDLAIIQAFAADIPNAALPILANNPLVRRVALDRVISASLDRTGPTVGATAVREEFGYDGSGIGVAVIDSGVTAWHDDLTDPAHPDAQRVDQFVDFVGGRLSPYDDYGHGTHIAGIVAGNGFDSSGARSGIAPGTRLVVLKVLDGSGQGRISNVIAAIGYAILNKNRFNLRIINLSIAAGVYESYNLDLLALAAKRAVDEGLVVVASAGNAGRDPEGRTQYGAITAPGNAPWVLTVGASSHMGTTDRADDTIALFSSRGPTSIDRMAKPDLVAPGVGIVSLSDPNSFLFASRPSAQLNGTVSTPSPPYLSLSGTSQAAPVVTGTIALMLQANPALTPTAVKAILQYSAEMHPEYDPLTQGAGFVSARGAVELARRFVLAPGETTPAAAGWSGQLIWGNRSFSSGQIAPAANAWAPQVAWGADTAPGGQSVTWGVLCEIADCSASTAWNTLSPSRNVVWGERCGGDDCHGDVWSAQDNTVVWSPSDGETVVWGTSEGETVVWGTSDGETVVWGTTDGETVVWGTTTDGEPAPPSAELVDDRSFMQRLLADLKEAIHVDSGF